MTHITCGKCYVPERSAVIIRDPIERVTSCYRFCKQKYIVEPDCTVKDFIATVYGAINFYAYKYSGLPGHLSGRCARLAVERAIAAIASYDHVGFIEELPSFIDSLGFGHQFPRARSPIRRRTTKPSAPTTWNLFAKPIRWTYRSTKQFGRCDALALLLSDPTQCSGARSRFT